MNMKLARAKAEALGLDVKKRKKIELVRSIQKAEGNQHCYATAAIIDCLQLDCCWRDDCAKMYKRG